VLRPSGGEEVALRLHEKRRASEKLWRLGNQGNLGVKKGPAAPLIEYGRQFDIGRPLSARAFVTRRSAPQLTSGQCLCGSLRYSMHTLGNHYRLRQQNAAVRRRTGRFTVDDTRDIRECVIQCNAD